MTHQHRSIIPRSQLISTTQHLAFGDTNVNIDPLVYRQMIKTSIRFYTNLASGCFHPFIKILQRTGIRGTSFCLKSDIKRYFPLSFSTRFSNLFEQSPFLIIGAYMFKRFLWGLLLVPNKTHLSKSALSVLTFP